MKSITIDQNQFNSLLTDLKELTDTNAHGEALEKVAHFFEDQQLFKAFEAINTLHNTVGYLDSPIAELRHKFTGILWERIIYHHGEETQKAVYNCL
jgi:hypothetical protein